jgi:prepilin-type N-terminal cleavage/methylation domain-containing protein
MSLHPHQAHAQRGFTLVEAMVSLGILAVGLLAMAQLQVYGIRSNQGARATMRAAQLAGEIRSGIEQLDFNDPQISDTGGTGPTAPTPFGSLLFSSPSAAHAWSDSTPLPGVTTQDAALEDDPFSPGQPLYKRRWTVWGYTQDAAAPASAKIIAISVMYSERGSDAPREVLLYTQRQDPRGPFNLIELNR